MVNIETVAIATGAFILFLTFLGWLLNRGNNNTNNTSNTSSSGPQISSNVEHSNGRNIKDGDSYSNTIIEFQINDTSGQGLNSVSLGFKEPGGSRHSYGPDSISGSSETKRIDLATIAGNGNLSKNDTYKYEIEATDNANGRNSHNGTFIPNQGSTSTSFPKLNLDIPGNPYGVGQSTSDVYLDTVAEADNGETLNEVTYEVKDPSGNPHTYTESLNGRRDSISPQLSKLVNFSFSSPLNLQVTAKLNTSGGTEKDRAYLQITDSSGTGQNPGGGNNNNNNVNVQQVLQALLGGNVVPGPNGNLIINNPQQQQQQQQMMGPGGAGGGIYGGISPHIYTMMMQQMQQMQMSQQQMMQQMMQFMQQNNYNQINNQVIAQFMQQVMDVDIDIDMDDLDSDGSGGDTNVNIEIKKVVNNLNVQRIENNLVNVVKNVDISINQRLELEIERIFTGIIQIINNNQYEIQGDVIILKTSEGDEKVKIQTLTQFLNILSVIKKWEMNALIMAIANQEIDINASLEVKLEELILIYQEAEKNQKKNTNIVIEDLKLNPRPEPGMSSSDITFYTRCGSNTKLQEIMLNFDGNQKAIGVSSPSKEVKVSLSSIIGSHQFQAGETHNYSTKVIDQTGNSRNRTKQVIIGSDKASSPKGSRGRPPTGSTPGSDSKSNPPGSRGRPPTGSTPGSDSNTDSSQGGSNINDNSDSNGMGKAQEPRPPETTSKDEKYEKTAEDIMEMIRDEHKLDSEEEKILSDIEKNIKDFVKRYERYKPYIHAIEREANGEISHQEYLETMHEYPNKSGVQGAIPDLISQIERLKDDVETVIEDIEQLEKETQQQEKEAEQVENEAVQLLQSGHLDRLEAAIKKLNS